LRYDCGDEERPSLFHGDLMKGLLRFFVLAAGLSTLLPAQERTVYVGTYTDGASKGIYSFRFDSSTGKTSAPSLAAESSNPSFLAMHPDGRFCMRPMRIPKEW
jgi:Lactonase, 7-bladed beta-propeller